MVVLAGAWLEIEFIDFFEIHLIRFLSRYDPRDRFKKLLLSFDGNIEVKVSSATKENVFD